MALETFNFPYHTVETTNPETGFSGQFGGSYVFSVPPSDPPQRIFTLHFPVMKYFLDNNGNIDPTIEQEINMKALIDFYTSHYQYKSFHYNHPVYGLMETKFYKPIPEPEVIIRGMGAVKEFTVQLVEIP